MEFPYTAEELSSVASNWCAFNKLDCCYVRHALRSYGRSGCETAALGRRGVLVLALGRVSGSRMRSPMVWMSASAPGALLAAQYVPPVQGRRAIYHNSDQLIHYGSRKSNGLPKVIRRLDASGHVSEGSGMNIVLVLDGR